MKTPSVIVIGAGVGGIAAAAHLARSGVQVTVLEKNERPGGRCDRFSRDGHHFDTGPTLLVMPLLFEGSKQLFNRICRQSHALTLLNVGSEKQSCLIMYLCVMVGDELLQIERIAESRPPKSQSDQCEWQNPERQKRCGIMISADHCIRFSKRAVAETE